MNNKINYIFENTKNILDNTKHIFKNIIITEKEKYNIYPFVYDNLDNIYNNIIKKRIF